MLYLSTWSNHPIKRDGYRDNVSIMSFSQVLNYGAGNLILGCAKSTFLSGNKKILKQPFKILCKMWMKDTQFHELQMKTFREKTFGLLQMSAKMLKHLEIVILCLIFLILCFFSDSINVSQHLFTILFFGLRRRQLNFLLYGPVRPSFLANQNYNTVFLYKYFYFYYFYFL